MDKNEVDNYLKNKTVLHPAILKVWEELSDRGALKGLSDDEVLEVVVSVCEGLIKSKGGNLDYNGGKPFDESDIPTEFYMHESDPENSVKFTKEQTDQVNEYVKNHPDEGLWKIAYDE